MSYSQEVFLVKIVKFGIRQGKSDNFCGRGLLHAIEGAVSLQLHRIEKKSSTDMVKA